MKKLDLKDPKYEFRKGLIELKYEWYRDAVDYIPVYLRSRVINIEANQSIEVIHDRIQRIIMGKLKIKLI